jgi:hypothetical protein
VAGTGANPNATAQPTANRRVRNLRFNKLPHAPSQPQLATPRFHKRYIFMNITLVNLYMTVHSDMPKNVAALQQQRIKFFVNVRKASSAILNSLLIYDKASSVRVEYVGAWKLNSLLISGRRAAITSNALAFGS